MRGAARALRAGRVGAHVTAADAAALAALVVLAALYFFQLDGWRINDDEGSYLYAAWRISLGEVPYRDFLTPQLPAFLLPGGALLALTGPEAWPARALAVMLTLGSATMVWATARRLFAPAVALVAGPAVLLHPLIFADNRTYRPEPFMLFLATLGVLLFARGAFPRAASADPPRRAWLAASGAVFGLAVMAKLFAVLPFAACLAWLVVDGRRRGRTSTSMSRDAAAMLLPAGFAVAAGLAAFVAMSGSDVIDAVLGHHLRQGAGMSAGNMVRKGLGLFAQFVRNDGNGLLVAVAIAAAAIAWREARRKELLFAWVLPTTLVFLLFTRQLFPRHLMYAIPALATLYGLAARWLYDRRGTERDRLQSRALAAAMVAGLLVPWIINDWHQAWQWEAGTRRAGDFIQLTTAPDDLVLADYSELNFYGLRPTTYSAASLSEGAARSGQITWNAPGAPHRIEEELHGKLPPLVLVDTATEFGQLSALTDEPEFAAWLDRHYGQPAGTLRRHHQEYRVYAPRGRPLPLAARLDDGPSLLAVDLTTGSARPGDEIAVRSAWRAEESIARDLVATVSLVDEAGRQWAAADTPLRASGTDGSRVRPTSAWVPGELTSDRAALPVPIGTPPGTFEVWLALYDPETLDRLEAHGSDGGAMGQRVPAGPLVIEADPGSGAAPPPGTLDMEIGAEAAEGLALLGRGPLPGGPVLAGEMIDLDLWWRARGTATDLSTRVALGDPERGAVAADVARALGAPGSGSASWPDEEIVVRQQVRVPVLADAGAGTYEVTARLVDGDGVPRGDALRLGEIGVIGRDLATVVTEPPSMDRHLDATFGETAALLGANGDPWREGARLQEGTPLRIELVWRALATADRPWKVSVQLLDPTGRPVAQSDRVPGDPPRPTTGWLPGEVVLDEHVIEIPAGLPPGALRVIVVMYDPESMGRLPAGGADALPDAVLLGEISVGR